MKAGKTALPIPFVISDSVREWARTAVPLLDIDYYRQEFEDYYLAHGKMMVDWSAAFRNWCRKAMDYPKPHLKARPVPTLVHPKMSDIFSASGGTMSRVEALKKFSGGQS